jgi:hypothetical protein
MRQLIFFLVTGILLLNSCEPDKKNTGAPATNIPTINRPQESSGSGSFSMSYGTGDLSHGMIENWGNEWYDTISYTYEFDVYLISSGIKIYEEDNEFYSASGKGHVIGCWLFSNSPTTIIPGTYHCDTNWTKAPFTFVEGLVVYNWPVDEDETGYIDYVYDGTVSVSGSDGYYIFTFDLTCDSFGHITGSYIGTMRYYDYNKKKYYSPVDKPGIIQHN